MLHAIVTGLTLFLVVLMFLLNIRNLNVAASAIAEDCSCGYYDSSTARVWTESTIAYFNETDDELSVQDFLIQDYSSKYGKGWNAQFRQGARSTNSLLAHSTEPETGLELWCEPSDEDHTVYGAGIRTIRQDIFYGTFRASFHGSPVGEGGSAISMMVVFNDSQSWSMDNIHPDSSADAWVSMISHGEFPSRSMGVNYTKFNNSTTIAPWNFTEYRVDWSSTSIDYYLNGQVQRRVTKQQDSALPTTPAPLYIKHWSTGDTYTMQGPPTRRVAANVRWIRMFFNSSLTTAQEHQAIAQRCDLSMACSVDDPTLRASTTYPVTATLPWKQAAIPRGNKAIPTVIAILSICFSTFLLAFTFLRRIPWSDFSRVNGHTTRNHARSCHSVHTNHVDQNFALTSPQQESNTCGSSSGSQTSSSPPEIIIALSSTTDISSLTLNSATSLSSGLACTTNGQTKQTPASSIDYILCSRAASVISTPSNEIAEIDEVKDVSSDTVPVNKAPSSSISSTSTIIAEDAAQNSQSPNSYTVTSSDPTATAVDPSSQTKPQIDYLAGLITVSALLVTAIHFTLTFSYGAIEPGSYIHYNVENWARKIITPIFLNLNWIGPFLMVSTRFLVATFLKNGDLRGLAEKTVSRPFRLLIPVAIVAMAEYFLMDAGATKWLEYLPSVTWSTWPYATVPQNFGTFISEILQLAYLIPNAAPQITYNYCTGILWTIPVQLQGTWTSLLAILMISQITTPWKRITFYVWCVLLHWYALSWGIYFYLAILLTDLDISYAAKTYLNNHTRTYRLVISCCSLCCIGGLAVDLATNTTGTNYATYEYGIHPDPPSARAIISTPNFAYPQYYEPKLNGVIFSFGMLALVELSPRIQRLFSFRFLVYLHPHTFTIYLIHGFIFWSLGSWICIFLAERDVEYGVNVFIVALCCYTVLFVSLPAVTPCVEGLAGEISRGIWRDATQEPAKIRGTLYPFSKELLERDEKDVGTVEVVGFP